MIKNVYEYLEKIIEESHSVYSLKETIGSLADTLKLIFDNKEYVLQYGSETDVKMLFDRIFETFVFTLYASKLTDEELDKFEEELDEIAEVEYKNLSTESDA